VKTTYIHGADGKGNGKYANFYVSTTVFAMSFFKVEWFINILPGPFAGGQVEILGLVLQDWIRAGVNFLYL
jgi:hypothetical protein